VKGWVGASPAPKIETAKNATVYPLPLKSRMLRSITAHNQGLKVKRHVVFILDPRSNWGKRMFLLFRVAPRLLLIVTHIACIMCLL